ncbi:metallophosphoesterase [Agrococcus sp. HG114]|uniref:metallophosphoesterase n=1 Tax=Agrococcus sp. HG114 TaxID=2969757 RepID=UPI00215AB36A|nr:metallophosphoesterase [Agrococcus sp. HG114]MCR8671041.1 metallophosphoesterase [Agrococcus sp. HG114]
MATYATAIEPRAFRIRHETLRVLPPGARPLTLLHLADIHLAPWQEAKLDWLEGLAWVEPDLIVNTGDSLGHRDALPVLADALRGFRGVPGFYVHGSNDVYGPVLKNPLGYFGGPSKLASAGDHDRLDTAGLERAFDELGWLDVNNGARAIEVRGTTIAAFGVSDPHRAWDRLDETEAALSRMRKALGDAPRVTLGITHAPYRRILDAFVDLGADAILAGHTHGGQVRVPGGPAIVTNCDIPRRQASGLSSWAHEGRSVPLNVSQGIGSSIFAPFRLGTPPEAVVVSLEPRDVG